MKALSPIIKPLVTEKASKAQEGKKYSFAVKRNASKKEIRKAVEEIYGVKVAEIRTMIMPKKTRVVRRGKQWTKRPVYKKAIVSLKEGKTIDPNNLKDSKDSKDSKKK